MKFSSISHVSSHETLHTLLIEIFDTSPAVTAFHCQQHPLSSSPTSIQRFVGTSAQYLTFLCPWLCRILRILYTLYSFVSITFTTHSVCTVIQLSNPTIRIPLSVCHKQNRVRRSRLNLRFFFLNLNKKNISKKNTISNALFHHCTDAWVTRPERPKGAKDDVKQARRAQSWPEGPQPRSRGPEGPQTSSGLYFQLHIFR